jgi:hypothetical protein
VVIYLQPKIMLDLLLLNIEQLILYRFNSIGNQIIFVLFVSFCIIYLNFFIFQLISLLKVRRVYSQFGIKSHSLNIFIKINLFHLIIGIFLPVIMMMLSIIFWGRTWILLMKNEDEYNEKLNELRDELRENGCDGGCKGCNCKKENEDV